MVNNLKKSVVLSIWGASWNQLVVSIGKCMDSRLQKVGIVETQSILYLEIITSSIATKVLAYESTESRKLKTFKMRCLRDILGFTLLDKRNEETDWSATH